MIVIVYLIVYLIVYVIVYKIDFEKLKINCATMINKCKALRNWYIACPSDQDSEVVLYFSIVVYCTSLKK